MMRVVMENAGLSFWPALSLVIFFVSCLGVIAWLYRPGSRDFYRKMGRLALENHAPPEPEPSSRTLPPNPSAEE